MKKGMIILSVLALALVAGLLYSERKEIPFLQREYSVYQAIPAGIPLFFEFGSPLGVPASNPVFRAFRNMGPGPFSSGNLISPDSLLALFTGEKSQFTGPILYALKFEGRNDLTPLLVVKASGSENDAAQFFREKFPETVFKSVKRKYDQYEVNEVTDSGGKFQLCWALENGLLIASTRTVMVERALRQLVSGGIMADPGFSRISGTAKTQSEISMYIHHARLPEFISRWLNQDQKRSLNEFGDAVITHYSREIAGFAKFGDWSGFDIQFADDGLNISGLTIATDSLHPWIHLFKDQKPQTIGVTKILPENSLFYTDFSLSDPEKFFDTLDEYFKVHKQGPLRENYFAKVKNAARGDVKSMFETLSAGEIAVAVTDLTSGQGAPSALLIFSVRGKEETREQLLQLFQEIPATEKEVRGKTGKADHRIPVRKFPFPSFPGMWLGAPFGIVKPGYISFSGNYLILAEQEDGLAELLRKEATGETLFKSIPYQRFYRDADPRSTVDVFLDISRGFDLGHRYLDVDVMKHASAKRETAANFKYFNWQIIQSGKTCFNNLNVDYSENSFPEPSDSGSEPLWIADIGGLPANPPCFVVNHNDRRHPEILVQNEKNILRLISHEGRVIWSRNLREKIMGTISQVDAFRNGKLQYLFNTGSKIYLIDRDGKDAESFPLTPGSPATNSLSVFDYDGKQDYRIFIAGADKKIRVFDITGRIVDGWKSDPTGSVVTDPVRFVRLSGKDYIFFADKSGLYIQDRRGAQRVATTVTFDKSGNPLLLETQVVPRILVTDQTGLIYNFYFTGKSDTLRLGHYSPGHFFTAGDLNGDNAMDFVFADEKKLECWDAKGTKLFSKELKGNVGYCPRIVRWNDGSVKIGVAVPRRGEIYLFNSDGSLLKGFPLTGYSDFIIGKEDGKSGGIMLITSISGESLGSYRLY